MPEAMTFAGIGDFLCIKILGGITWDSVSYGNVKGNCICRIVHGRHSYTGGSYAYVEATLSHGRQQGFTVKSADTVPGALTVGVIPRVG
jgi:hypothetical protein